MAAEVFWKHEGTEEVSAERDTVKEAFKGCERNDGEASKERAGVLARM